ncbi:MAG: cytochrome b [Burkholderiales bacterium]
MALRSTPTSFGTVARTFHWGMAFLIIAALALIELADLAPRGSALRRGMRDWHAQAGLLVLALVWFRLAWKLLNPEPAIVPPPAAWQRSAAHAVEWTFYALMIVLPVLGVAMMQADGKAVALLGLQVPVLVGVDKGWAHRLEDVHEWLGNAMMALIALHVAATAWHGIVLRDNTLARMR